MERKELTLPFKDVAFKAQGDGGYAFEGYASKFNGVDSYGDTILPGAYKNALKDHRTNGTTPKMLFNHQSYELPVGKWNQFKEDDDGLYVSGSLTKGMSLVEDLKLALADGTVDGLSVGIGMKPDDYEWVDEPKSAISRIIKNVSSLREISLVTFPADAKARVDMSSIKSELEDVQTVQDLERFLRDAGSFSKTAAAAVVSRAKAILRGEPARSLEQKQVDDVNALLAGFTLPEFTLTTGK